MVKTAERKKKMTETTSVMEEAEGMDGVIANGGDMIVVTLDGDIDQDEVCDGIHDHMAD